MLINKRSYPALSRLEALRHRTELSDNEMLQLKQLTDQKLLEDHFESLMPPSLHQTVDMIWHYTYADYHHDIQLNVILIEADTVHLLKLNDYRGLHTINQQGMLTEFFTRKVKDDLAQLMSIKLGIDYLLDRRLNIDMRCVCLGSDFELDIHSSRQQILTIHDLADYFKGMTAPTEDLAAYLTSAPEPVTPARLHIQNGLRCPHCNQLSEFTQHHHLILCQKCRQISTLDQAFIDAAREYLSLYPDSRLTKGIMYKWCNKKIPATKVASLLKKHFSAAGKTKGTYYLLENVPL
ncbi:hypothetical protein ERX37_04305 [Macrococcus hajekii]|uniref:NERD domain-containing protein n=1 Tax=Macrococcus hajekii TaxID=198482 RepID=A0A4R6BN85_9STAP|nr:hypothetical protein [Macrococcus hajekii]TDM03313.1 hypothetical protein ERX37_04305 [Macrococcus hajekii]GGA97824.1 hypothetical protein GCM10007190_02280 [Macrococcus hajekii]